LSSTDQIVGVILAGGKSRRMFPQQAAGGEKAFTELGGRPMIAHVAERFAPQVARLIVSANADPAQYAPFAEAVIPDISSAGQGPLAGLLAAMIWAQAHAPAATAISSVTVDVPFLPLNLVARLDQARKGAAAIATSAQRRHPTIGIWPITWRERVKLALESNELGVNNFALRNSTIEVSFPFGNIGGFRVDPFFNANTPEDLLTARRIMTGERD